ncbi:mitochondrial 37S ribosomal protein bS6m KNAG_0A06660 [Huiozyma naganishii CBS 8797]|uniref:Small ribosomal subunit protein bS6m n=1 Tax=Huiozyma naganishii (strain ATCC MYA-139 / BCRC 22969 / CBS 8797 / KCTC 17520 / NBRC 10181 / NCYC 3082 / Yp74L-3) TaxID=1071383 RepID=J7RFJ7_HUIN7|nr:hypothetical protein KNAG_0A06660 [Kazachstania naganishii CBS 8797]CCK68323.1 hypothetical protein KNAG_0A06660 [Kazachstania naganishii CBS 8797]
MLYELIGIVRVLNTTVAPIEAKELLTSVGKLILNNRGVIRSIIPVGTEQLSEIMRKDQEQHFRGYRFVMLFDSSAAVQSEILRTLKKDPRVIRSSIIKLNTTKELDIASSMDRANGINTILQKINSNSL